MSNDSWKISVQDDYFARIAAREYSDDAGMAVIREFAQNSTDAGATEVRFGFHTESRLSVTDNGRGCDAETVRTRLLTPLGTKKEADAIGGFGKAKELLFFANPSWTIGTRDVEVHGRHLSVDSFVTGRPSIDGFAATVQLPEALFAAARRAAIGFLQCSERPGVRWIVNGNEVETQVCRAKRAVKDFGFCKAYVTRDVNDSRIYLRTGGLLTATRWGHHGPSVGQVVLELHGTSSELLTPARDWFRHENHRRAVESWLSALVTNAHQTLADEVGDEVRFEDLEAVEPLSDEQRASIGRTDVVPAHAGVQAKVAFDGPPVTGLTEATSGVADEGDLLQRLAAQGITVADGAERTQAYTSPRPARAPRRDGFDMSLLPRLDGVRRLVVHTGGKKQAGIGARWLRKHPAMALRALASWTTAVRAVAARAGLPMDAVGFTFAPDVEAEFVATKGRFALLLNPLTIDLTSNFAAEELLDRALHEAAHLVSGSGHDERFVVTEFSLRRKVRGAFPRGAVNRALRTSEVHAVEEE